MFWIKTLMQVKTQREVSCYITGQPVNGEIKEWRWLGEYFAAYAMRVNEMWRLERVTIMDKSKLSSDMRTVGQDWRSQPLVLYYYSLDAMVILAILASPYFWTARLPHKNDIHRISYVCIDFPLLLIYKRLLKELRRRNLYPLFMESGWRRWKMASK